MGNQSSRIKDTDVLENFHNSKWVEEQYAALHGSSSLNLQNMLETNNTAIVDVLFKELKKREGVGAIDKRLYLLQQSAVC